MKTQVVHISAVRPSPKNPRLIKDIKFKKLVQSIKDLPDMLKLRPIVVDENNVILGGNMRYKACIEAGLKEIPIIVASDMTKEQQDAFVIKDNVSFGEWDWDILGNEFNTVDLADWGVDVWQNEDDISNTTDYSNLDVDSKLERFMEAKIKSLTIPFESDEFEDVVNRLENLLEKYDCNDYRVLIYKILENEDC
tara:strand:- start:814 stop:1395 length:582 start_codon:yes stop_codon:yes gene_type:complete